MEMIAYYSQNIVRAFTPFPWMRLEMLDGKLFTGLKEELVDDSCIKTTFVNGVPHGIVVGQWHNHVGFDLYLYGTLRFSFNHDLSKDSSLASSTVISYLYDNLTLEYINLKDGVRCNYETLDFSRADLDFARLARENEDVVDYYLEMEDELTDLDTAVYCFNNLKPEGMDVRAHQQRVGKTILAHLIQEDMKNGRFQEEEELMHYYVLQNELREKVITEDGFLGEVRYVAGVDVAYNDVSNRMVGAVVVLDAQTLEVVDRASHEMEIAFPYIPGLFSFREIPPILEAFRALTIKPDLIVCDAHGIAHPKNVGMATHLGIELGIPTIGCAKKRLVGHYDKEQLGPKRGDTQDLIWDAAVVGKVLRTQDNTNPMFVSIGHKISLDTAVQWVMRLTPSYRLPETTRHADHLVNQLLKERTDYDFMGDEQ